MQRAIEGIQRVRGGREREREYNLEERIEWTTMCACTLANFPMLCHFAPVFHIRSLCRPFTPTNAKLFIKLYGIKLFSNYASLRIKMTRHIFSFSRCAFPPTFTLCFSLFSFRSNVYAGYSCAFVQANKRASLTSVTCSYASTHTHTYNHTQIGIRMLSHSNANIWTCTYETSYVYVHS